MLLLPLVYLGLLLQGTGISTTITSPFLSRRSNGIFDVTLCTSDEHCHRPLYCCTGMMFNFCCINGRPASHRGENQTVGSPIPIPVSA